MMEAIGQYLLSVAASAMLLSLTQALLPKGSVRKLAGIVGGLIVILAVLSPVCRLEEDILKDAAAYIQRETGLPNVQADSGSRDLLADIIRERIGAYILDKAAELGMDARVSVEVDGEAAYPTPTDISVTGRWTPQQKDSLSEWITTELGIPAQRQEWNID